MASSHHICAPCHKSVAERCVFQRGFHPFQIEFRPRGAHGNAVGINITPNRCWLRSKVWVVIGRVWRRKALPKEEGERKVVEASRKQGKKEQGKENTRR
jgi:hypothetical protein